MWWQNVYSETFCLKLIMYTAEVHVVSEVYCHEKRAEVYIISILPLVFFAEYTRVPEPCAHITFTAQCAPEQRIYIVRIPPLGQHIYILPSIAGRKRVHVLQV